MGFIASTPSVGLAARRGAARPATCLQIRRRAAPRRSPARRSRGCAKASRAACRNGRVSARQRRESRRHAAAAAAVELVADDRMAGFAQVHANLMRAARADRDAHERDAAERLDVERRASARGRAAPCRGSTSSDDAADRGRSAVDSVVPGGHRAPDQRDVLLDDRRDRGTAATARDAPRSCLAMTITPDVPRSSRCTMPGRSAPPMPLTARPRGGAARSRACPSAWPAAGMHDHARPAC